MNWDVFWFGVGVAGGVILGVAGGYLVLVRYFSRGQTG